MAEINLFNGGVSLLKDSHKLEPNEMTSVVNADINSGSVVSLPKPEFNRADIFANFTEFHGKWFSDPGEYVNYARIHNSLYKSDGILPLYTLGDNGWLPLGIGKPENTPIAEVLKDTHVVFGTSSTVSGSLPQGETQYLIVVDGIPYETSYDRTDDNGAITIDASYYAGRQIMIYRLFKGRYMFVTDKTNHNDGVFKVSSDTLAPVASGSAAGGRDWAPRFCWDMYSPRGTDSNPTYGFANGDDGISSYLPLFVANGRFVAFGKTVATGSYGTPDRTEYHIKWNDLSATLKPSPFDFNMDKVVALATGSKVLIFSGSRLLTLTYPSSVSITGGESLPANIYQLYDYKGHIYALAGTNHNMYFYKRGANRIWTKVSEKIRGTKFVQDVGPHTRGPKNFITTDSLVFGSGIFLAYVRGEQIVYDVDGKRLKYFKSFDTTPGAFMSIVRQNEYLYVSVNRETVHGTNRDYFKMKFDVTLAGDNKSTFEPAVNGKYMYALTYEDARGNVTARGPESNEVETRGGAIQITLPTMPTSVKRMNFYRRGNAGFEGSNSFFLAGTSTTSGEVLIDKKTLAELGELPPVPTTHEAPDDLLYIMEHRGRLFGATKAYTDKGELGANDPLPPQPANGDYYHVGKTDKLKVFRNGVWSTIGKTQLQNYEDYYTLVWSNRGQPNNWKGLNYLNVDYTITGLGRSGNGLVLYSRNNTYILLGAETENFSFRLISNNLGCIDHRSIQGYRGSVIAACVDGISITNGGDVKLLSYDKLGIKNMVDSNGMSLIASSALVGDDYVLLLSDDTILRLNMSSGTFTYIDAEDFVGLATINGELFGSKRDKSANFIELFRNNVHLDNLRQYEVTTGDITDSSLTNLKEYNKVRVSYEGSCSIEIFIDDKSVLHTAVKDVGEVLGIPNEHNKGYSIRFEVIGTGKLHAIDYSVQGRGNA